jgi:hypothetical protein
MLPCALIDPRSQTLIGIGEAKQPLLGSRVLHAACLCARSRSAIVPMLQIGFVAHLASAPWRAAKSSPADGPPDHARAGDRGGCRCVICPAPRDDSTGAGKHAKIAKCVGYDDGDIHRLIHRSLFLCSPRERAISVDGTDFPSEGFPVWRSQATPRATSAKDRRGPGKASRRGFPWQAQKRKPSRNRASHEHAVH